MAVQIVQKYLCLVRFPAACRQGLRRFFIWFCSNLSRSRGRGGEKGAGLFSPDGKCVHGLAFRLASETRLPFMGLLSSRSAVSDFSEGNRFLDGGSLLLEHVRRKHQSAERREKRRPLHLRTQKALARQQTVRSSRYQIFIKINQQCFPN